MRATIVIVIVVMLTAACQRRETTVTTTLDTTEAPGVDTSATTPPEATETSPTATTTAVPPPTVTSATSTAPAATVAVRLTDYRIEMLATLPPGPTSFMVHNEGERKHNFEIEGQGLESKLPSDLESGQIGELRVVLKPGQYEIYCPVGDHRGKHGMETTLTVR